MTTIFARSRQSRVWMFGVLGFGLIAAGVANAQTLRPRIASEINGSDYAELIGTQQPQANLQNDLGRVPAGTRLNGVSIYFKRSAAQEADLQALLAAQQDPSSPLYHQWLTPDQFAARFGMAQSDLDKVQSWLEQQGFAVDSVNRSRNAIHFSASVGQLESAFHTQMHFYNVAGVRHFAPSTALSVPAALAPVVSTIGNLTDFRPRPMHVPARASFTSGQTGNVFFAPGDIAVAYDMNGLYQGGANGAGQTIAILGQSYVKIADAEAFYSAAGITRTPPNMVLVPGTGNDGTTVARDESESDLDLEWSGAMAPGADVAFVYVGNGSNFSVYDSAQYAIDQKIGNILSMSYSSCETELSASNLTTLEGILAQAAAQGQTFMAASGDQGSTACSGDKNLTTAQQQAVVVNYPASSAYVLGVGGTEITSANSTSSNSTYWSSTSGTDVVTSLKQYIPEIAWNDDSSQYGLSASGGGTSTLVKRPSWQAGVPGIASGSYRLVPDISFYSSPNNPGYLYCTSDTSQWQKSSPVQQASCNSGFRDQATGDLNIAGGTSFATPIFAGMLAVMNQQLNYTTGQGLINPKLYQLAANSATYGAAFHDVTSGNNNCTAGSTYCSSTTGYSAGTGYDEVTGLGSVDVGKLTAAWGANTGASAALIATTTTVTPSNATPKTGDSITFAIKVTAADSSTPTGNVTLQIDGGTKYGGTTVTGQVLASGSVSYTTSFSAAGTHQVVAQYAGDTAHASSTGVGQVSIAVTSSGKGTFSMAFNPSSLTLKQGGQGTETLTVTPAGGYTGTVDLTYTTSNDTALKNLCLFAGTGINSSGNMTVGGTTAVAGQITVDTNAADCVSTTGGTSPRGHLIRRAGTQSAGTRNPDRRLPLGLAFAGLFMAGLLGRSSRKLRGFACVIALAAISIGVSACGSSSTSGSSGSAGNPAKGTYTVTFTGQDSVTTTNSAQASFTLVIQ